MYTKASSVTSTSICTMHLESLNRTCLSPWGWWGLVCDFLIWSWVQISSIKLDSNCLPWSEWSCHIGPNRQKNSLTSTFAMVSASWFGMAYASTHLVKESLTAKMYWDPVVLSGNGPIISIATSCMGYPAWTLCRGAQCQGAAVLRVLQGTHVLQNNPTSH